MIKVAVDAMGGDNAPEEIVAGAVMAANTRKDIKILLVGQEERVSAELKKHTYNTDQIEIVNATEVIETEEPPVNAIRKKKDSSIVVGMNMVRRDEADAVLADLVSFVVCHPLTWVSQWRDNVRRYAKDGFYRGYADLVCAALTEVECALAPQMASAPSV